MAGVQPLPVLPLPADPPAQLRVGFVLGRHPAVAIGETVTVMLLSLSCLLSRYCHATVMLLSSTAAIVIMVNPYQPFLPAVTISK